MPATFCVGPQQQIHKSQVPITQPKPRVLKLLFFNARSLFRKLNDLAIANDFLNVDLICICESWLNSNTTNAMLSLAGFNLVTDLRVDRQDTLHGIGGGLIVYAKTGIKIKPIKYSNDFIQYIAFEVEGAESSDFNSRHCVPMKTTICMVYRSPNSSEINTEKLCQLIKLC